jgi:hypothetical protein
MNALSALLSPDVIETTGWALVHFLWQGALVGLALGAALRSVHTGRSSLRYTICCVALAIMAFLPVITAVHLFESSSTLSAASDRPSVTESTASGLSSVPQAPALERSSSRAASVLSWLDRLDAGVTRNLPWLVMIWGFGVLTLSMRHAGGWWSVRRLR